MPWDSRDRRKYDDAGYRKQRAEYAAAIVAGTGVKCWRCGKPIERADRWELGHDDATGRVRGPEHAACNQAAGREKGAATIRASWAKGRKTPGKPPGLL